MENKKIVSNIGHYRFSDLVDVVEFEEILKSFYNITKVPNALVGIDGEIISQVGWISACKSFHRANPQSNLQCLQSNHKLIQSVSRDKISSALCKNGLLDYATPIVVDNQILATLFLGQVLNKPADKEFFRGQAKKFDYDENKYLEAIDLVPVVSQIQMESIMNCIVKMAQMLAKTALSKLRETILENDLNESSKQRIELKDILDFSPIGIGWSDIDGKIEYINHQFTKLFGYVLEDVPTVKVWYEKAYPDIKYRKKVTQWNKKLISSIQKGVTSNELEVNIRCKDGKERRVFSRVSWVCGKRLVNFIDITNQYRSELRNKIHDSLLEMVAKQNSLDEILLNIVNTIEQEDLGSICSILLLDEQGKHLLTGAAPNLPDFYNKAINGVEIGKGIGSCGTAAYLGKRVIVEDIMTHKYWKSYKDLAKKAKLGSCWSEPIISSTNKILGTFAIYHSKPTTPNLNDIERISFAANLAAIAIENRKARLELEHRAYSDYLTGLANRRYFVEQAELELSRYQRHGGDVSLMMFDIDLFKQINDKYGHSIGDLVLQKVAQVSREILRDIDLIGRIGGEEFAVLLPQTNLEKAFMIAERLRMAISKAEVIFEKGIISNFTASFGVIDANSSRNIDEILIQADLALYKAKNSGRNRVCTNAEVKLS